MGNLFLFIIQNHYNLRNLVNVLEEEFRGFRQIIQIFSILS